MRSILLCTDMDRTLIPNGRHAESPRVRELFSRFVSRSDVSLAYVTGRHLELVQSAMIEYALPTPDFIIADVGTSIYHREDGQWHHWQPWEDDIASDWKGLSGDDLHAHLSDLAYLTKQGAASQSTHKLSYFVGLEHDAHGVTTQIEQRLDTLGIRARVIWSLDEENDTGLIDILPHSASKLHAIEFLMDSGHFDADHAVFAGDSGNDLEVLLSPMHAVLVANGEHRVVDKITQAKPENTYIAEGGFLDMNGCYAAGILEGVAHFCPEFVPVLRDLKPEPYSAEDFEEAFEFMDHWEYAEV